MLTVTATNLPRLMACNGSRLMSPAFPNIDPDRTLRDEGDAAHYMALAVFNGQFQLEELIERKAPNGVYMTPEMSEHVDQYLNALDCGGMEIETSFGTDQWRVNGRADHIVFTQDTLVIDDFKYGWSIVDPKMNWTLIAHAIGTCTIRQVAPAYIVFRIHQPRPYHPDGKLREWRITYNELMALYDQLVATLSNPSDTLQTGSQCRGCYALAHCPAARAASYNAIDAADIAMADEMSEALISHELIVLEIAEKTIERRREALSELAKHRITRGAVIDGFAVEHQFGHRRFNDGLDGKMLSVLTGADMVKPGTVTPAEAERRLIAKGKSKDDAKAIISSFSHRPNTGLKLVRSSANDRAKKSFG